MKHYIALTIIADDRPGIIEKIAGVVAIHGGNWLESSMSRLSGKFAGILLVDIAEEKQASLLVALDALYVYGIRISGETSNTTEPIAGDRFVFTVVGNDRPGIVGELSSLLARLQVNVEELYTNCEAAPMSSEILFRATATVALPESGLNKDQLQSALESLSDDLMVELENL